MEGPHFVGTGRAQGIAPTVGAIACARPVPTNVNEIHIPTTKQGYLFRSLTIYGCVGEIFYLLFVILSPLPGFHLTSTPVVDAFPWTLFLARTLVAITGNWLKQYSWISFSLIGMTFI